MLNSRRGMQASLLFLVAIMVCELQACIGLAIKHSPQSSPACWQRETWEAQAPGERVSPPSCSAAPGPAAAWECLTSLCSYCSLHVAHRAAKYWPRLGWLSYSLC